MEQSHRRSGEGFDRSEDFTELLCMSPCCRLGLEGLQELVGTGMLPVRALSPGSSLSVLRGGGTGSGVGRAGAGDRGKAVSVLPARPERVPTCLP